jgi:quercetin dioxygenase-like cupin family protein
LTVAEIRRRAGIDGWHDAMAAGSDTTRVLTLDDNCPALKLVEGDGRAVALVWPGTGAAQRSMHHIALHPGDHTVPQRHAQEAVYYVKSGAGSVLDPEAGTRDDLVEGSMIHIEPGTAYRFKAGIEGLELLGGPCPPDPDLYAHL